MCGVVGACVVVTTGVVTGVVLDVDAAPAIAAISSTTATGTAIFAHSGHDRTQATGVVAGFTYATGTVGMIAVGSIEATGTRSVGAADSGGYHLPSAATHQPGSSGC